MADVKSHPKRLLTKGEFCSHYGIGSTKFYQMLNCGAIQALKAGTKTLIPVEEAERWKATLPPYKSPSCGR